MASKTVTLSSVIRDVATKTNTPTTDAGKIVRSHIRKMRERNATSLYKEWPELRKHERGNAYPSMPVTFAEKIVAGRVTAINARRSMA